MDVNRLVRRLMKRHIRWEAAQTFARLTTIGCGGGIAVCAYPSDVKQLKYCLRIAQRLRVACQVVGMGSNTLASDDFFDGLVVVTRDVKGIRRHRNVVTCECGVHTTVLASFTANEGLGGGEFMYCLPASVGGAVAMNAGCFGGDMSGIVRRVTCLLPCGRTARLSNKKCRFTRRGSYFKESGAVVLTVDIRLTPSDRSVIKRRCRALFAEKSMQQPLGEKSFGCAFYNADGTASRLIDRAGLKGTRVGGAEISKKHAGFFINIDNCTSKDIYLLMQRTREAVEEKFGESLQTEVTLVGFKDEKL